MNKYWLLVIIGGFVEILWVTGLKHADSLLAWAGTVLAIYISFVLLIRATDKLPVATVYAVFTGIGTAGTVLVDMFVWGEPVNGTKIFFILLLIAGIIGLKLVTNETDEKEVGV